jgi:acyl-coenzyme A thioesterase PaaI-like protein
MGDRLPVVNYAQRFEAWETREVPTQLAAQFRVASALRGLLGDLNLTTAPEQVLDELTEEIEALRARLAPHPRQPKLTFSDMAAHLASGELAPGGAETFAHFDHSAFMGAANPIAPPMRLTLRDGRVEGSVRFGDLYEGPPGHVHGGFVAAILDEVLGAAQAATDQPGMTARLEVQYRAPTPLHTDLTASGWVERVEGRKIFAAGEVWAGERVTATAAGLFVSVDFAKLVPPG